MSPHAMLMAAGLIAASLSPALADSVTAKVRSWDPITRTLTLEDQSQFVDVPSAIVMPQTVQPGTTATIIYEGSESGVDAINSVTIKR
jgi:hypothetical protein